MPKTLASVENEVRERYPHMARSMIRKLAKQQLRESEGTNRQVPHEVALIVANPLTYVDPTGEGRTNV